MQARKRKPKTFVQEGRRYGRLLAMRIDAALSRPGTKFYECECDCGNRLSVRSVSLLSGNSKSCGCLKNELSGERARQRATHGQSRGCRKSKLYDAYTAMLSRCYNQENDMYPWYGGKGVAVCLRWRSDRVAFFSDMGEPPSQEHSVDRIDPEGGYWCGSPDCPECGPVGRQSNCRWATRIEQANNRRNNRLFTHDGRTMTLAEWSRVVDITYHVLQARVFAYNWPIAKALTTPVRSNRKRSA